MFQVFRTRDEQHFVTETVDEASDRTGGETRRPEVHEVRYHDSQEGVRDRSDEQVGNPVFFQLCEFVVDLHQFRHGGVELARWCAGMLFAPFRSPFDIAGSVELERSRPGFPVILEGGRRIGNHPQLRFHELSNGGIVDLVGFEKRTEILESFDNRIVQRGFVTEDGLSFFRFRGNELRYRIPHFPHVVIQLRHVFGTLSGVARLYLQLGPVRVAEVRRDCQDEKRNRFGYCCGQNDARSDLHDFSPSMKSVCLLSGADISTTNPRNDKYEGIKVNC